MRSATITLPRFIDPTDQMINPLLWNRASIMQIDTDRQSGFRCCLYKFSSVAETTQL
jgi:hypothetical protein